MQEVTILSRIEIFPLKVTITKNCEIDDAKEETHPFVTRVGYSLDESNLLLGEEKFSYGYGG